VPGLRRNVQATAWVQGRLERLEGILWVRPNRTCASLAVGFQTDKITASDILAAIHGEQPRAQTKAVAVPGRASRRPDSAQPGDLNPVRRAGLRFGGLSAVMAGAFVRRVIFKMAVGQSLFSPLGILAALSTWPLIKKAMTDLRERRFGLDGFLAGSILTATAMGEALTALEILWIDSGAEFLTTWISQRSRRAISDILQVSGKNTFISVDGVEVEVAVDQVRPGDLVVLHTGEKVSVDGRVESGRALVDESPINGRSEFVLRQKGDSVLAGTLVREGVIFVRAQKVGDETYLSRVIHLVEDALENQAPIQGVADQLAVRLLKLGGLLTLGTLAVTGSFWRAFTVLLVMACPCATVLSASAPISAAINAAARRKILIKGGRYLEEVGQADIVCFDKTGTLTTSQPALRRLVNLSDRTDEDLLQLAYTAEMHNFHPLALAVKNEAAARGLEPGRHVVCQYQLGEGVTARMNGQSIHVGNRRFMDRHRVDLSRTDGLSRDLESEGLTVAFLALQQELLGVLGFANQIRPEAEALVGHLVRDGVGRVVMITGEEGAAAGSVAAELGIDDWHHSVLPEAKAHIVAGLRSPGHRVLMVGDGINDALALAEADVGIAMGAGGSEVAIEAADIALVNDDLGGVAYVRSLSRATMRVVHQNFWIATGSNLAGVTLGALGLLSPMAAGLIHIVHTLGILANSSRPLYHRPPAMKTVHPQSSRQIGPGQTEHEEKIFQGQEKLLQRAEMV
jgi:cation-transporting P-type ATPase C